jgi:uncharacterized hydantoinase/oxoprolinase family protein
MTDIYPEPGMTEGTRKEIMEQIDRQIAADQAMLKHHAAVMDLAKQIMSTRKETWLIRQLKTMRVDFQLSSQDHYADVITAAILELGGEL